jgi:hypothetical protein
MMCSVRPAKLPGENEAKSSALRSLCYRCLCLLPCKAHQIVIWQVQWLERQAASHSSGSECARTPIHAPSRPSVKNRQQRSQHQASPGFERNQGQRDTNAYNRHLEQTCPPPEKPMQRITLITLCLLAGNALAEPDAAAGLANIQSLGQLNGQALACQQMALSSQSKSLMIKHAPKTRRYGEVFEEATNAGYLEQGKDTDKCASAADFKKRLADLAAQLQSTLPPAP